MWNHRVGLLRVAHVFLQPEIGHRKIEMQGRGHAHRRQVRRSVAAGLYIVEVGEHRDAAQMTYPARVRDARSDVVDELLLDELLAVPDAVEHFPHGKRGGRVAADETEGRLVV